MADSALPQLLQRYHGAVAALEHCFRQAEGFGVTATASETQRQTPPAAPAVALPFKGVSAAFIRIKVSGLSGLSGLTVCLCVCAAKVWQCLVLCVKWYVCVR